MILLLVLLENTDIMITETEARGISLYKDLVLPFTTFSVVSKRYCYSGAMEHKQQKVENQKLVEILNGPFL